MTGTNSICEVKDLQKVRVVQRSEDGTVKDQGDDSSGEGKKWTDFGSLKYFKMVVVGSSEVQERNETQTKPTGERQG